jgi:hypothetical protein
MNDATEKFDSALADINSGIDRAFAQSTRPRVGLHTPEPAAEPEAAPVEPPPYQHEYEAQTAPEDDAPPVPASLIEWIYLLHGQLAYLDANMLRIERFLGMGDRPAAP